MKPLHPTAFVMLLSYCGYKDYITFFDTMHYLTLVRYSLIEDAADKYGIISKPIKATIKGHWFCFRNLRK